MPIQMPNKNPKKPTNWRELKITRGPSRRQALSVEEREDRVAGQFREREAGVLLAAPACRERRREFQANPRVA